jgi:hypothetical protein
MSRRALFLVLTLPLACGREVVFVDPPPASSDTDTTGTDTTLVTRVDLRVTVGIAPGDSALATRLGFVNGRLSNAQVTARRLEGQQGPQAGTTDSLGQVTLPALLEGAWSITALRALTDAERTLLDSANRDVTGFAGAGQFEVSPEASSVTVTALAGRQGSLVISEAYLPYPLISSISGSNYLLGQYIEVHNNSFDTLYLDGKILGRSIPWVSGTNDNPCSVFARWLEDPEGIWSRFFWAFPGTGTTYPLPPGGSAVVAIDAIDHRVIHPSLLDLSGADFEFIGAEHSDVDNPAVPNMAEFAGFSNYGDEIVGHGPRWVSDVSIYLAEPFDVDSLVRDNLPVQTPLHVRIPRARILDVLTSGSTPETKIGSPYCPHFVHPGFDGGYAELVDGSMLHGIRRKALAGSPLLQRTRVSAVDFEHAPPTPGRVP